MNNNLKIEGLPKARGSSPKNTNLETTPLAIALLIISRMKHVVEIQIPRPTSGFWGKKSQQRIFIKTIKLIFYMTVVEWQTEVNT